MSFYYLVQKQKTKSKNLKIKNPELKISREEYQEKVQSITHRESLVMFGLNSGLELEIWNLGSVKSGTASLTSIQIGLILGDDIKSSPCLFFGIIQNGSGQVWLAANRSSLGQWVFVLGSHLRNWVQSNFEKDNLKCSKNFFGFVA